LFDIILRPHSLVKRLAAGRQDAGRIVLAVQTPVHGRFCKHLATCQTAARARFGDDPRRREALRRCLRPRRRSFSDRVSAMAVSSI